MFGTMLDLTAMPPSHSTSTIWRWVPSYILPNIDNLASLPQTMHQLYIEANIPHPVLGQPAKLQAI